MNSFPKIIDNRKKILFDCLTEVSGNYDELSIATGYWDLKGTELLLPYIKNYKKIRLLIGRELLIPRHELKEVEVDFPDLDIFKDLEFLKPESGLRSSIVLIKELIEKKKLEVKVFKKTFLHSKCYIFGNFKSKSAIGIIGSSNFTKNGLTTNLELNAGESDSRVVQFKPNEDQENGHLSWFEFVWNNPDCINWSGRFEELIDTSIHGEKLFSPYEMYIKTLDIMYGQTLKKDNEKTYLHSKKLQDFQQRNVEQISWRLQENGVAMLADSVGLGKTISAIGVIKRYTGKRVIVIAPKSLQGQWDTEIAKERLLGVKVVSLQNKNEIDEQLNFDRFLPVSLFVIDESHNLRNFNSKRFNQIKDWIINNDNADTLLLTATPINNSLDDLTNQILLGTRGDQDLLKVNVRNSEGVVKSKSFFDALLEIKKKINQNRAKNKDMKPIYEEARRIIDPILRQFVIRNTRQSIEKELEGKPLEIDGKSFKFPKIKVSNINFITAKYSEVKLKNIIQQIEDVPIDLIGETTDKLEHPFRQLLTIKKIEFDKTDMSVIYRLYQYILSLSFVPYRTEMYQHKVYQKTLEELENIKFESENKKKIKLQLSLYGLLRVVLLKRFESSSYALLTSVKRYLKRLEAFEDIFIKEKILLNLSEIDNFLEELEEEFLEEETTQTDEEIIKKAKEKGVKVSNTTHNIKAIEEDLIYEQNILKAIIEIAEDLEKKDKKIDAFISFITQVNKENPKRKILVFSFFTDTIEYLQKKIQNKSFMTNKNSAFVSGKKRTEALESADRFAPIARDSGKIKDEKGELTYLFSTDVLAEGQNLQDCDLLINYDLHWNPVRMIQRNGRINRLGSPFSTIEVKNIVPHKELEEFLGLVSKLTDKINLIKSTIGSDSSVLGEEINPIDYKGIYDQDSNLATLEYEKLEKEADIFTDDEYIKDLRDFYENSKNNQEKESLEKIPLKKWGVVDNLKASLLVGGDTIVFTSIEFSNNKKQFTFYKNNLEGDSIDVLLNGEALQILRSNNKNRLMDKISFDKNKQFEITLKNGPQITRYEKDNERLTPSQNSVLEEARQAGWLPDDIHKLESLLTSRNVFQNKLARKYTRELRETIKEGKTLKINDILNKIKKILPEEQEEKVKIKSINPIFGFARFNR
jgi:superfamily II DNA or RNA helicase